MNRMGVVAGLFAMLAVAGCASIGGGAARASTYKAKILLKKEGANCVSRTVPKHIDLKRMNTTVSSGRSGTPATTAFPAGSRSNSGLRRGIRRNARRDHERQSEEDRVRFGNVYGQYAVQV